MLKRKQKNDEVSADVAQGISAGQNRLSRSWLYTTLAILLPLLAGFAYLLLVRDAALQREQVTRAAGAYAVQQAAHIEQLLIQYQDRLQAAANSPLALSAIASGREQDLTLVEKAMLDYFPGLASLRLIAIGELGTAGFQGSNVGLRNHIELDLLRRTSQAEDVTPESYQFEGKWLTSMAQLVQHPRQPSRRAVILATLDNQIFSDSLSSMGGELGRSSLHQKFRAGALVQTHEVAAAGNGGAEQFTAEAALNGDSWIVRFTPSAQMLSLYRVSSLPLLICLGVLVLVTLVALVYYLRFINRALEAEVSGIIEGAGRKTAYSVDVPALLPLARQLRRVTLQRSSPQAARAAQQAEGEEAAAASAAAKPAGARPTAADSVDVTKVPRHIFRAYDIRGIVEKELTERLIARIGKALGTMAGQREQQALIVGCDGRSSSPAIKNMFVKALLDSGRDVVDIGMVPTPALYYATETLGTKSGVMVTASHNPADYNGFKIVMDGKPFAGNHLQMLLEQVVKGEFSRGAGRLAKQDIKGDYCDAVVGDIAITTALKIVVDAGNGVAGELAPTVLEALGCDVVRLYCDIDGSFPNHHPDPGIDENLADLKAKVVEEGADFGVAFDGDGDRLTIVGPAGNIIRNDTLLMLFAEDIVSRNPGADVVFDVKCSQQLTQLVSKHGGRPILWRTGHSFMRDKVRETGALLGGEFSGHIYFGERWFGFDDAIYATARLAEIISSTGMDLPALLSEFPATANTPEIKIPVSDRDKFEVMKRIADRGDFSPGKVTNLDGIRVDYNDGWGLVRASNTTPALTARFEGNSDEALERIRSQFRDQLKRAVPSLDVPF